MKQTNVEDICTTIKKRCDEKGLTDKVTIHVKNTCHEDCHKLDAPVIEIKCSEDMAFKPFYDVMSSVFEERISSGYSMGHLCGDLFVFSKEKTFLGVPLLERIYIAVKITEAPSGTKLIPHMDAPEEVKPRYDNPLFLDAGQLLFKKAHLLEWNKRYGGRK